MVKSVYYSSNLKPEQYSQFDGDSPGAVAPALVFLKSSRIIDRCISVVVQLVGLARQHLYNCCDYKSIVL